jgi:predicted dehydrogenase
MGIARIRVLGFADSDEAECARLARSLGGEFRRLDEVRSVEAEATGADAPTDAKGDVVEWAKLVVEFSGGVPLLVDLIRSWAGRNNSPSVRISIDGDEIELEAPSRRERQVLVEAWLARHGEAKPRVND